MSDNNNNNNLTSQDAFRKAKDLPDESLAFISKYTGITDLIALRQHVLEVTNKATQELYAYRCIREFMFLFPRIARNPFYSELMMRLKSKPEGARLQLADVGCCFGTDVRKLILDGWPKEDITAVDIEPGYWQFGMDMYSDKEKLNVPTIWSDLTKDDFNSDKKLSGSFDFIYTGAVLHCLTEDQAVGFVKNIKEILKSGGVYFGSTLGAVQPMPWSRTLDKSQRRYLHSQETLQHLFEEAAYVDVQVNRYNLPSWFGFDQPGENQPDLILQFVVKKGEEQPDTQIAANI